MTVLPAVEQRIPVRDVRIGAHAAQAAGRLDEHDLGAQPGCANRGRRAGRPAPGHYQVVAFLDGNLAGQAERLAAGGG